MDNLNPLIELLGFKGINTDIIEELLPPIEEPVYITDGENILIKDGKIEKLRGTDYLNGLSATIGSSGYESILQLPIYRKYNGTKYLLAITPRKVYALGSSWAEIGTIDAGGNDAVASMENIDDLAVMCVSDDGEIKKWNGTAFSDLVDPATLKARHVVAYKTFLILLRTIESGTEYNQRVWPSYPGDPDRFEADDKLDLDSQGMILGGRRLDDSIIVYMSDSIHRVYLVSEAEGFTGIPISSQGLLAPKTLCGAKDRHFYLSREGLMQLRSGMAPEPLSKGKFNRLVIEDIDPLYYYRATAFYDEGPGLLYVCYPKAGSAVNNVQVIYDVANSELVSKKTLADRNITAYGLYEKDLTGMAADERRQYGVGGILISGDTVGQVREQRYADFQDVSTAFVSSLTLPPTFMKNRNLNKRILQADLFIEKLTDETINFSLDIANEANTVYSYLYAVPGTGNEGIRRYEVLIDVLGKEFRTKIRDVNNIYGFKFHGITFRGYYSSLK